MWRIVHKRLEHELGELKVRRHNQKKMTSTLHEPPTTIFLDIRLTSKYNRCCIPQCAGFLFLELCVEALGPFRAGNEGRDHRFSVRETITVSKSVESIDEHSSCMCNHRKKIGSLKRDRHAFPHA